MKERNETDVCGAFFIGSTSGGQYIGIYLKRKKLKYDNFTPGTPLKDGCFYNIDIEHI